MYVSTEALRGMHYNYEPLPDAPILHLSKEAEGKMEESNALRLGCRLLI